MTKTPNLDLPQFVGTDPVKYTDFNDAFMKLDGAVPLVEEGTWTPRLISRDGTAPTYTTDYSYAQYYKIGKLVYISFHMKANITNAGSGYAAVTGLPFQEKGRSNGVGLAMREAFGALRSVPAQAYIPERGSVIYVQNDDLSYANEYKTGELWLGYSGCYVTEN